MPFPTRSWQNVPPGTAPPAGAPKLNAEFLEALEAWGISTDEALAIKADLEAGKLKVDQIPEILLRAADLLSDYVVSGLGFSFANPASLNLSINPGIAYLAGKRVAVGSSAYVLTASSDTYFFLAQSGAISFVAVAAFAPAPATPANNLRLGYVRTDATATVSSSQPVFEPDVRGTINQARLVAHLTPLLAAKADLSNGKVLLSQIPETLIGGLNHQAGWNASTNTPDLNAAVKEDGFFWKVTVAGATNLSGITDWGLGDLAVWDGAAFYKIDNSEILHTLATEAVAGLLEIATQAEVTAGTDDSRAVTPLKLAQRLASFATNLDGLSDVVISAVVAGHSLVHDGTNFVNKLIALRTTSVVGAEQRYAFGNLGGTNLGMRYSGQQFIPLTANKRLRGLHLEHTVLNVAYRLRLYRVLDMVSLGQVDFTGTGAAMDVSFASPISIPSGINYEIGVSSADPNAQYVTQVIAADSADIDQGINVYSDDQTGTTGRTTLAGYTQATRLIYDSFVAGDAKGVTGVMEHENLPADRIPVVTVEPASPTENQQWIRGDLAPPELRIRRGATTYRVAFTAVV